MVLEQGTIEFIALAGAALGIAGRTIMPYLKARTENGGELKFESKYVFAVCLCCNSVSSRKHIFMASVGSNTKIQL